MSISRNYCVMYRMELVLIFFDMPEPFTKLLAGGWAFLGGILLILQSLQLREVKSTNTWHQASRLALSSLIE